MTIEELGPKSAIEDEIRLRWGFLEEVGEPCLVVTARMEFVYLNAAARRLVSDEWFGKRCFVMLQDDEACAWSCPKIESVNADREIYYGEESLVTTSGEARSLAVAVVPVAGTSEDGAAAILYLRGQGTDPDLPSIVETAEGLRTRVEAHFSTV